MFLKNLSSNWNINLANITITVAILLSIVGEFYSISGLSKLFSGSGISIILMSIILAAAKVCIAWVLKVKRQNLDFILKSYLILVVTILMFITSLGIYGYLSSAYQITKSKEVFHNSRVDFLNKKINYFSSKEQQLYNQLIRIDSTYFILLNTLSVNSQTQTIDKKSGKTLTNIFVANKKNIKTHTDDLNQQKEKLSSELTHTRDSILQFNLDKSNLEKNLAVNSEIGPLKFISDLTGINMDNIVNVFLLLFVMVIDPLAIALILTGLTLKNNIIIDTPPKIKEDKENIITPPKKIKRKYIKKSPIFFKQNITDTTNVDGNVTPVTPTNVELKPKKIKRRKIVDTTLSPNIAIELFDKMNKKKV